MPKKKIFKKQNKKTSAKVLFLKNSVTEFLDSQKVSYRLLEHKKVYTAFNEAETSGIDPKSVVKTVLIKLSKPAYLPHFVNFDEPETRLSALALVCLPSKSYVDFKKIETAINKNEQAVFKQVLKNNPKLKKPSAIKVGMALEKDIEKQLKTKVGLLHPFGAIWNLPVLLDKALQKNKKLLVSAGSYTHSVEITAKDFERLVNPLKAVFSKSSR